MNFQKCLPEGPFELFFSGACACYIDSQKEFFEIDVSILVSIEGSEDVIAELLCISTWEKHFVHVDELHGRKTSIWTILLKALIPLLDCVLVVARVRLQELEVLLTETLLALNAAHAASP